MEGEVRFPLSAKTNSSVVRAPGSVEFRAHPFPRDSKLNEEHSLSEGWRLVQSLSHIKRKDGSMDLNTWIAKGQETGLESPLFLFEHWVPQILKPI